MYVRVIKTPELEAVFSFAKRQAESENLDPFEAELASWKAPWRKESLEHYLQLGWSFGLWSDEQSELQELKGFCLTQPLLFYQGLTQSLWVESIVADSDEVASHLLETCYKWARDKHLQQLVFAPELQTYLSAELADKPEPKSVVSILTAKVRNT